MISWLKLTNDQRKTIIDSAEQMSGINAKAIEKDWWVTLCLKALFQTKYADNILFKGGTSLSKCWKLISRFSEDIDIALDPTVFGMPYQENPSKGFVDKLKRTGSTFTSNEFKDELENQLAIIGVPAGILVVESASIKSDMPDTDPQTLFIKYKSLYESNPYLADEVKIEVGVRSIRLPLEKVSIQSLLNEFNPYPAYSEIPFEVAAAAPRKTFLEKLFLLHEEFGKPDKSRIRSQRMSRHLYDIYKMIHSSFAAEALDDKELYSGLMKHRERYMRISWVQYETLAPDKLSFLPPQEVLDEYRKDYQVMQEQMIHEKAATFDEIIRELAVLQNEIREV
ncbi:MAG: nucleotidyl transferase AbiEii/AbiGii toxin family protein [Chitinophagaceae bacterium]|jgi:hypothetical protein|nr:nucleotidyl transferase AbiEii/AbiGii toxin family protein [Chitinophagaceae bacterium]MCA6459032.1 nucleotidyl transferase AbiEii/AbiGii toxin family protein [Chitinophagaceae bacterium]MCA6465562.1 nucleotidyl transferase AbiEii/AbiGii toxin family protein [Chitinophagaceae bacterium]